MLPATGLRGFGLPAVRMAIATACFCGLPAATSVRMFALTVFGDEPFFSGIATPSKSRRIRRQVPAPAFALRSVRRLRQT